MTRDEAVEIIKRGLGFLNSTVHDGSIVAALKQAQALREGGRSLPWFLLQEDEAFLLTPGEQEYALPTGFLKEDVDFNEVRVATATQEFYPIDPLAYDEALRLYNTDTQRMPQVYSIRKDTFAVFPIPDVVYGIQWSYYKSADVLDSNIENEWLLHAPYVLISDAGLKMAKDLRDLEATSIYRDDKAQWDDWFTREMTARRESTTRYVVGKYA